MSRYDGTGKALTPDCPGCRFFLETGSAVEGRFRATSKTAFRASRSAAGFCTHGVALKVLFGPAGRRCQLDPEVAPGLRRWPTRDTDPAEISAGCVGQFEQLPLPGPTRPDRSE